MKGKRINIIILWLVAWLLPVNPGFGAIHIIYPDGEKNVLQKAIDKASPGDTLLVKRGHYYSNNILVNKPLVLIGLGQPVVDGRNQGEIFTITADSVELAGFIVQNVGTSYVEDWAGIKVKSAKWVKVHHNVLKNTFFGIYLEHAHHVLVTRNLIAGEAVDETSSGNAIHAWYCHDLRITHNMATGHRDGIYFEFVENSLIAYNVSYRNIRYGMHFMFSDHDVYLNNVFKSNGVGVAVMYSRNISMFRNTFQQNWGGAAYGLLLKEMTECRIGFNRFQENTIALYAESATRTVIVGNEFILNGWGIKMLGSSTHNRIIANDFYSNSFDLATNTRNNFNDYAYNYWDHYAGYDLDKDGIGDVPYRPVKLFAYLVEQFPPSIILMHSPLMKLLDFSEKIIPAITPEYLLDTKPKMKAT